MIDRDFTSREAAEIAGINPATFRSYFKSGHFRVIGSMKRKEAAKNGLAHVYSWEDVVCFAVAQTLIDEAGAHPSQAFEAAMHFAYIGDERRLPGSLYDEREFGWTYIALNRKTGAVQIWPSDDDDRIFSLLATLGTSDHRAATIVLLNQVFKDMHFRHAEMVEGA